MQALQQKASGCLNGKQASRSRSALVCKAQVRDQQQGFVVTTTLTITPESCSHVMETPFRIHRASLRVRPFAPGLVTGHAPSLHALQNGNAGSQG